MEVRWEGECRNPSAVYPRSSSSHPHLHPGMESLGGFYNTIPRPGSETIRLDHAQMGSWGGTQEGKLEGVSSGSPQKSQSSEPPDQEPPASQTLKGVSLSPAPPPHLPSVPTYFSAAFRSEMLPSFPGWASPPPSNGLGCRAQNLHP